MNYNLISKSITAILITFLYPSFMFEFWDFFSMPKNTFGYSLFQYFVLLSFLLSIFINLLVIILEINKKTRKKK